MNARALMTDRCTTERPSGDANNWDGGAAVTTILSDQPCRYQESISREVLDTGAVRVITTARLYLPVGTDIKEADRVTSITDRSGTPRISRSVGVAGVARTRAQVVALLEGAGS